MNNYFICNKKHFYYLIPKVFLILILFINPIKAICQSDVEINYEIDKMDSLFLKINIRNNCKRSLFFNIFPQNSKIDFNEYHCVKISNYNTISVYEDTLLMNLNYFGQIKSDKIDSFPGVFFIKINPFTDVVIMFKQKILFQNKLNILCTIDFFYSKNDLIEINEDFYCIEKLKKRNKTFGFSKSFNLSMVY
jgi:hypothetical protein